MSSGAKNIARVAAVVLAGGAIAGCEIQRAQEASDAKSMMVGMSREQVLSCMGSPVNAAKAGATEVWSYNSGNGRTDSFGVVHATGGWGWTTGFDSSTSESRSCKVDVVMNAGRVSRVNYTGPTGGLITKDEQCAFAVDICVQDRATLSAMPVGSLSTPQSVPTPSNAVDSTNEAGDVGTANDSTEKRVCTKDEREMARLARANGYHYAGSCSAT